MSKHLGYFATGSQSLEEPDGSGDTTHTLFALRVYLFFQDGIVLSLSGHISLAVS